MIPESTFTSKLHLVRGFSMWKGSGRWTLQNYCPLYRVLVVLRNERSTCEASWHLLWLGRICELPWWQAASLGPCLLLTCGLSALYEPWFTEFAGSLRTLSTSWCWLCWNRALLRVCGDLNISICVVKLRGVYLYNTTLKWTSNSDDYRISDPTFCHHLWEFWNTTRNRSSKQKHLRHTSEWIKRKLKAWKHVWTRQGRKRTRYAFGLLPVMLNLSLCYGQ